MANRDYTAEILSKRSRLYPGSQRWENVVVHLSSLEHAANLLYFLYERHQEVNEMLEKDHYFSSFNIEYARAELENYIPVRSIACIEGYFRLVYANLIDFGDPYRKNASKFNRVKFSIEMALSLQENAISIGEFVSHLLPLSSLEDINSTMSQLIDDDFLNLLQKKRENIPAQQTLPGFDAFAELVKAIKNIFELRHIYCHEIPTTNQSSVFDPPTPGKTYMRNVVEFLWISGN